MQTIRYAKVRAKQDPDYFARKHSGTYYGYNIANPSIKYYPMVRVTHGSVIK